MIPGDDTGLRPLESRHHRNVACNGAPGHGLLHSIILAPPSREIGAGLALVCLPVAPSPSTGLLACCSYAACGGAWSCELPCSLIHFAWCRPGMVGAEPAPGDTILPHPVDVALRRETGGGSRLHPGHHFHLPSLAFPLLSTATQISKLTCTTPAHLETGRGGDGRTEEVDLSFPFQQEGTHLARASALAAEGTPIYYLQHPRDLD
ncbi:hypothetical protein NDU88_003896 [Pleurodeles waltl]|uniref:Uncharacterized protein n=1 Tax=Pleurodeles waltl TaxID=8319 RepID=A0AAV7VFJ6_PLEWA|nr:hypothetical protein NDU88_003896 [Pleurodeles waltl]